jgi:hypothetical protein
VARGVERAGGAGRSPRSGRGRAGPGGAGRGAVARGAGRGAPRSGVAGEARPERLAAGGARWPAEWSGRRGDAERLAAGRGGRLAGRGGTGWSEAERPARGRGQWPAGRAGRGEPLRSGARWPGPRSGPGLAGAGPDVNGCRPEPFLVGSAARCAGAPRRGPTRPRLSINPENPIAEPAYAVEHPVEPDRPQAGQSPLPVAAWQAGRPLRGRPAERAVAQPTPVQTPTGVSDRAASPRDSARHADGTAQRATTTSPRHQPCGPHHRTHLRGRNPAHPNRTHARQTHSRRSPHGKRDGRFAAGPRSGPSPSRRQSRRQRGIGPSHLSQRQRPLRGRPAAGQPSSPQPAATRDHQRKTTKALVPRIRWVAPDPRKRPPPAPSVRAVDGANRRLRPSGRRRRPGR